MCGFHRRNPPGGFLRRGGWLFHYRALTLGSHLHDFGLVFLLHRAVKWDNIATSLSQGKLPIADMVLAFQYIARQRFRFLLQGGIAEVMIGLRIFPFGLHGIIDLVCQRLKVGLVIERVKIVCGQMVGITVLGDIEQRGDFIAFRVYFQCIVARKAVEVVEVGPHIVLLRADGPGKYLRRKHLFRGRTML